VGQGRGNTVKFVDRSLIQRLLLTVCGRHLHYTGRGPRMSEGTQCVHANDKMRLVLELCMWARESKIAVLCFRIRAVVITRSARS